MRMKDGAESVSDVFHWSPDKIDVEPGFNPRLPGPDLEGHIEWLMGQIKRRGFNRKRPLIVSAVSPEGRVIVRAGHNRLEAVKRLIAAGEKIVSIPVLVEERETNDLDRLYDLGTENENKPLADLEYIILVKRARGYGQTDEQIIAGFGKNKAWLERILDLASASPDLHNAIRAGSVATTTVVKAVRDHGKEAAAVVGRATDHARAEGRNKVRPRDVAAVTKPRNVRPSIKSRAIEAIHVYTKLVDKDTIPVALRIVLDDLAEEVRYETRLDHPAPETLADLTLTNGELHVHGLSEGA